MRIVYVLNSLGMGGAERQVLALAARISQRGHTVALLVLRPRLAEEWPTSLDVFHLDIRRNPLSVFRGLLGGRRFLLEFRPDLVHSHCFHANFIARLLKLLVPSSVVLSTVHNIYEGGWPRMLAYRLTDGLSRRTTAVSQAAARRYVRLKAVPPHKCLVLPNGIDTAEFAPSAERRAQTRAAMDANDAFLWLAAGRIAPSKDYPTLLRAFAQVYRARPDARLWIAGAEASAVDAAVLPAMVSALGFQNAVRWLGLRRDMPALFDAADAFVQSSAWEGMPLAIGEAMSMEKPLVVTHAGGVGELVGNAGSIVPPADPNALAAAMLVLMQASPDERLAQARIARQRIANHFSMDTRTDEWETLYRLALQGRG
jgi:glycosyltransferase involved in cell wall biosynthesis